MAFGLMVDQKNLCCGPGAIRTTFKIDDRVWHPNVPRDRLHRWLDWSGALFEYRMLEEQQERDALWSRFYSCNVSLKREFFVASGGFDPDFVFDYEDLDLGWRLGQRGMRLLYARQAVVEHLHPYGWPAVERRYRSRAAAERLMMAKHGWFKPWFHGQMQEALNQPRASSLWARAVDWTPARPARLRRAVERRADRHYRQRLAPVFLEAWSAASSQRSGQQATAAPRPGNNRLYRTTRQRYARAGATGRGPRKEPEGDIWVEAQMRCGRLSMFKRGTAR